MNHVVGEAPFEALKVTSQVRCRVDFAKPALLAVVFLASAGLAFAQPLSGPNNYDVKNMSFDTWCQEAQRYPVDRCRARRHEDVKVFEDYRAVIERYELEHLKRVQQDEELRADINRDPSQTVRSLQDGLPYPDFRRSKNGW
jgi:hypothetical protein